MNSTNKLLSEIVAFRTYAKHLPHAGRRETFEETLNRNLQMHLEKFPRLSRDIVKAFQRVHELKVMPSMRSLQFGGNAILKNNARSYNCSFAHIDDVRVFGEVLFLLLSGTGVGFSCQRRHVNKLPIVQLPREEGRYIVQDSIIGWAQALDQLMDAYFLGRSRPIFDYSDVREKGAYLVTTGAKAPGSKPLALMLNQVEQKLKSAIGRRLRPIEIHDIVCMIADCVLAGGIRRAALISLFDRTDEEMLKAKHGSWWEAHPYRARANNSAVLPRDAVTKEEFKHIYDMCIASNSGEPGFYWTNDADIGTNPCAEISLNSNQFCNLTTINQTGVKDKKDWLGRVYAATLLGTLQAAYSDFPYLRPIWKQTTENEALLGVSNTGIADAHGIVTADLLQEGAMLAKQVNSDYAKKLGINQAARITTIKPEGTASCILGSSSGIHARHAEYYLRRIRMNKNDPLSIYLANTIPELVEADKMAPNGVVVTIPQEAAKGAIIRDNESAKSLFDRTIFYHKNWIQPGHNSGINTHNVSVTISYKPDEVETLFNLMWDNRGSYTGISILPFDESSYIQMPFESCDKNTFDQYEKMVKEIDLSKVREDDDNTNRLDQVACAGGACEIT
jgi:ribonucleoside-diphosphate reductase alpha chain